MGVTSITKTRVVSKEFAQAAKAGGRILETGIIITSGDSYPLERTDIDNRVDLPSGKYRLIMSDGGVCNRELSRATKTKLSAMLAGFNRNVAEVTVVGGTVRSINLI